MKPNHFMCKQCVCLTNFNWRSTSNPKCHVTFSKTKMNVNWHLHFLLKCHFNITCLVIRVISISKVSIHAWFFLQKSHSMSNSKLCMSMDMHFFGCKHVDFTHMKSKSRSVIMYQCLIKGWVQQQRDNNPMSFMWGTLKRSQLKGKWRTTGCF